MAVSKRFGWPGGPVSPILRKVFVGDPADAAVEHNPGPSTKRGIRRSENTDVYSRNLSVRQSQSAPAGPGREAHRGPHSRPKAMSNKDFSAKMIRKEDFGC